MILGEKIKARRKELGYNADFLAEKTGLSRSTIFRYEKGDIEKIPTEILSIIAQALSTTPSLLMGWNTDGLVDEITTISQELPRAKQQLVLEFAKKQLEINTVSNIPEENPSVLSFPQKTTTLFEVRGITEVAAGIGFGYDDTDTYTVFTDEEPPTHDFATMINGDSMEPTYHNGDMLYLKETFGSQFSGQLLVVAIEDRTYFKKVYQEGNQLRLVSLNPSYKDLYFHLDEYTHFKSYQVVGTFTPVYPNEL
ncbi:Phage repressor [Streptococcus sp. DD10]|uniref:helix-turn-helix domain-containing protein n=1 Tax=Streptococcus sp. DD10 TaxID=1777878 RepID=UPI00079A8919|nr:S24 family peptidase [Streptococcus sp. DD10]KXT77378.1 Phage repressor [Streptococcus sp. DD10]